MPPRRRHFAPVRAFRPVRHPWPVPRYRYVSRPSPIYVAPMYLPPLPVRAMPPGFVPWDASMAPSWAGTFIAFWTRKIASMVPIYKSRPDAIEGWLRSFAGPAYFVQAMLDLIHGANPLPTREQLLGFAWNGPLTNAIAAQAARSMNTLPYAGALQGPAAPPANPFAGGGMSDWWSPVPPADSSGSQTGGGAGAGSQTSAGSSGSLYAKMAEYAQRAAERANAAGNAALASALAQLVEDWSQSQFSAAASSGTVPSTVEGCVQQVTSAYSASPEIWAALVKEAGSEQALIAIIRSSCTAMVNQCGGMSEEACRDKLCPGMTREQCEAELRRKFGGQGGGSEETKSSFPWWAVGLSAVVLGGAGLYWYSQQEHVKDNPTRQVRLNNADRELWIDNDEGLYDWWKRSRLSKREFIRQNREAIDAAIRPVIEGTKRQHHLKYG